MRAGISLKRILFKAVACFFCLVLLVVGVCGLTMQVYALVAWNLSDLSALFNASTLTTAVWVALAVSCLLLLLPLLGCIGVYTENKPILVIFSLVLMGCAMASLCVTAMLVTYGEKLGDESEGQLRDSLAYRYTLESDSNAHTVSWNVMQFHFSCCGVSGNSDWLNSSWILDNPQIDGINQSWPFTCCDLSRSPKMSLKRALDGRLSEDLVSMSDINDCYNSPFSGVHTKGCHAEYEQVMARSVYVIAGVGAAAVLIQLLLTWMVCQLVSADEPTTPDDTKEVEEEEDSTHAVEETAN